MTTDEIRQALSPPTVGVKTIATVLGISENLAYRGVQKGEIESIRVGAHIRIPTLPYRRKLGIEPAQAA